MDTLETMVGIGDDSIAHANGRCARRIRQRERQG
jgi:hypothetical protein